MNPILDAETGFFSGLIGLQYGEDVVRKLRTLSVDVDWAKGWPEDTRAFWNAEAFMWSHKIDTKIRAMIALELQFLEKGYNLDLGCGSYSYVPSVGYDIAEKMLQFNDNCTEKIVGDVEKELLLKDGGFDSCTAIFLLNYIENYTLLLKEIFRVLKSDGIFVCVLYDGKINEWQRQKEVNHFSYEKWCKEFISVGFNVEFYEKEKLWFFKCQKIV